MSNDPPHSAGPAGAESRAAAVRGTLDERPLPRLLHELFRKSITGCLDFVDDSGDESRIFLRDGAPVHIERPNDIDRLDQVLIEAGLLSPEVIRGFSATLPPGKRLGETLIEQGLITARALGNVLKFQMRRKLLRLFFPRKGNWAVYVEAHPYGTGGEFGEMRIDPRCLIYPGIRAAYDESRLLAELAPLRTHRFRVLPILASSLLEAMGFSTNDVTVRALGERPLSLADLPVPGAKAIDSLSVVIALLYTDLLETSPMAESAPAPARPIPTPAATVAAAAAAIAAASHPASSAPALSRDAARAAETTARRAVTGNYPAVNLGRDPHKPGDPPRAENAVGHASAAAHAPPAHPPPAAHTQTSPPGSPRPPSGPMSRPAVARQVTGNHAAVGGGPANEWSKSPSASNANATLAGQINEVYEKIGTISHFALLGIPETAPLAEVGAAYLKNVRLFHPDRLSGLGLGNLTEKAARIVAQLNEAQAVLADPKRRADYLAARARPAQQGPVVDSGTSILAAERSFSQGEALMRKGDFARAVDSFAEATRANPLEPQYKAYWAWARWDNPGPHKDRLVRETLKVIEDTLKERPRFPQGHHWIGLLHKHLGDLNAAAAAFRNAIAQDPNLLEAERELRVIELRRTRATATHPLPEKPAAASAARQKGGVLGKILKR